MRKNTKVINVGSVKIGGNNPIVVQSMTNTKTYDINSTVKQITALAEAGCDIVRVAVPKMEDAEALVAIKKQISLPLIADIHFDYRLALKACVRLFASHHQAQAFVLQVLKAKKSYFLP